MTGTTSATPAAPSRRREARAPQRNGVRDRFDDVPEGTGRVGAHRGRRPRGRGLLVVAWAALAVGLLVGGGVLALAPLFPQQAEVPGATGGTRTVKEATPITDPSKVDPSLDLEITVLNASPDSGADQKAASTLKAEGWPINGAADASTRTAKSTVVYYSSRSLEGVARGLVKRLGTGSVQLSDAFPGAPVTIVLGADYSG